MSWVEGLRKWRTTRNILSPSDAFVSMVEEEIDELTSASSAHDRVDALADVIVLTINQAALENSFIDLKGKLDPIFLGMSTDDQLYSALRPYTFGANNREVFQTLFNIAHTTLSYEGYLLDRVMAEVVREISSRQQSPAQALDWSTNGPSGKWLKDKSQDPSTLYSADYTNCRS